MSSSLVNQFYEWVAKYRESFRRALSLQTGTDIPEDPDTLAAYALDLIKSPTGYDMVKAAITSMNPVGASKSIDWSAPITTGLNIVGGLFGVDMSAGSEAQIAAVNAANERAAEAQSKTITALLWVVAGIAVILAGVFIFTKVKAGK